MEECAKMEETLKQYLDRININPCTNFIIYIPEEKSTMSICRKDLECKEWKHILEYAVIKYIYPVYDLCLDKTFKVILSRK